MLTSRKDYKNVEQVDTEKAVLGVCILETEAIVQVGDTLFKECFSLESHQNVYDAIISIKNKKGLIEPLVVSQKMRELGTFEKSGGKKYISDLVSEACDLSVLPQHADTLYGLAVRRRMMKMCAEIYRKSKEPSKNISELVDYAEKEFLQIASKASFSKTKTFNKLKEDFFASWHDKELLVSTGYEILDSMIGGYGKGDLIVVAGRTGMGKTTFMINLAKKLIEQPTHKCLFFTLEVRGEHIFKSIIMNLMSFESQKFAKRDNMTQDVVDDINKCTYQMRNENKIFTNDSCGISIESIRSVCRNMVYVHDIRVVFVDYLQLVHVENASSLFSRQQVVSSISRGLKELARELDITIVAGAQLNRVGESNGLDRPLLSSLRESGSIEQEADAVLILFRPRGGFFKNGDQAKNKTELVIAKNRRGDVGVIRYHSLLQYARFEEQKLLKASENLEASVSDMLTGSKASHNAF